jgi:hypothetical protein
VLNAAEHNAEERICDLFASALLMPSQTLRSTLQQYAIASPSSIIDILQQTAALFKVSMPALLVRINGIELRWPPCLLVYSRIKPNVKTGRDPKLRIEFSVGLGAWSNRRFWNGTPVTDANIISAIQLYDTWASEIPPSESGQFAVAGMGLMRAPSECTERGILMSTNSMGLWKRETLQCISSSALYTWKYGEETSGAYVLTVIAPTDGL